MKNKYDWLTREALEKDYEKLGSFKLISEKYKIPRSTIERYCKIFGIKTTPKINYTCNDNIFSSDTEDSFYMAGFIAADGCVYKHKSKDTNCMSICLSEKDKDHLQKLKNITEFSGPITTSFAKHSHINPNWKDVGQVRITIYSKQMISDLGRFEIGQRKSLTYEFPDWLMNHPLVHHFMRGYFDGDGGLHINSEKRITKKHGIRKYSKRVFNLRGTKSFLESFGLLLWKNANLRSISKPIFNNGIDMLRYSGDGQVAKIASYLYGDATIYMNRKFEIVKDLIQ